MALEEYTGNIAFTIKLLLGHFRPYNLGPKLFLGFLKGLFLRP